MQNNQLTLCSLFDGSGGFCLAALLTGIKPVSASEIEPFPIRVTTKRLPQVKHLGDICNINGAEIEPVDIITFGSPCQDISIAGKRAGLEKGERSNLFYQAIRIVKEMRCASNGKYPRFIVWENVCFSAGTLVTTEFGYKNIEDINIGERVKTHTGQYKTVVKVHRTKQQKVMRIKAAGSETVECTLNHPFYVKKRLTHSLHVKYKDSFSEPQWIKAIDLSTEDLIGYVLDVPDETMSDFMTEDEAWAVGRWLADGSVDINKSSPRIFISCGNKKIDSTREKLNRLPYTIHENRPHPTALNFAFTSWEFYKLIESAKKGAGNKCVPDYVFKLPIHIQKAVLDGYISGDGYIRTRNGNTELTATTASRKLAYGISRLIRNCYQVGCSISIREIKNPMIDGRKLNVNYPTYTIYATISNKQSNGKGKSFVEDEILWQPIKTIEAVEELKTVYNLSVEEDNTYEVNNIIVHNCGAFSSNKGEDFKAVLTEICKVKNTDVSIPKSEKWENAGSIVADNFSLAWRVFDSQFWGVPQRRKRIYLVADFDGECAGKVLFESESLSGYSEKSRFPWQRTAGTSESCTGKTGGICLNDQGGNRIDITDEMTCTLRAEAHHPPCVMGSAGFCTEHSAKSRSIGFENEKSPTLRAGIVPAAVYENHSQDTRYTELGDVAPTVSSTYGTGGNNQPFVVETFDVRFTSENTKNARHNVYETDTARTVDTGGNHPESNQGGIAVIEGNGSRPSHHGDGYSVSDTMYTLNTVEQHAVAYGIDRAAFNQGKNAQFGISVDEEIEPPVVARGPGAVAHPTYCTSKASYHTLAEKELANTLVATDYKDPPVINDVQYVVRRLTPTECARLQAFPDWWCSDLETENPTDADIEKWREVFNEYARAIGKNTKPKTDNQIRKWLQNPHSDSAEYKMWGNGICLNNAVFVLAGIAWAAKL